LTTSRLRRSAKPTLDSIPAGPFIAPASNSAAATRKNKQPGHNGTVRHENYSRRSSKNSPRKASSEVCRRWVISPSRASASWGLFFARS
jgi:hypothetical protein